MERLPLSLFGFSNWLPGCAPPYGSTTTINGHPIDRCESLLRYLLTTLPFFPANMWNTRTIRLTSIAVSAHHAGPRNHSNTSSCLVGVTPARLIYSSATAQPSWHPSINIVITAAVNLPSYWHARP